MNLILFERNEVALPLTFDDHRAIHLKNVLKIQEGEVFDLGVVNGPRGKGRIRSIENGAITFHADLEKDIPELYPVTLLLGAVRPPAARRILREAATLGLERLYIFASEKGEASYLKSRVWEEKTVRRLFIEGAEQAFSTRIPELRIFNSLTEALVDLPANTAGAAADNYEAVMPLRRWHPEPPAALAIGPERGWSAPERDTLRDAGFSLVSLGERVLRTDTAVTAATAIILSELGYW